MGRKVHCTEPVWQTDDTQETYIYRISVVADAEAEGG